MRIRTWVWLLVALLAAVPARAQETRGNINGTVQDKGGIIPGAVVKVTNTDTNQTQQLVTNGKGYFEAVLLNPGNYAVRVELQGFKTHSQTGISLAVGQTVSLTFTLEVGQLTEQVNVTAEAPLLDTTTVSSGMNFDRRMVEGAADVLEHAHHAVALHAGRRAGRGRHPEHLPGVHGRHDERRGRPGRHGQRLRQPQHRQQLHDRRRREQRLRPPHRQLAELRSD